MSYTALYRKYRPLKFSDMIGQDHITKTLKNQIVSDRVGHAYLFTGGRGTGKTTSAKILARAVNCLNPKDGEPCNECEICKGILAESVPDVVEMDAASSNSVDDIRQIKDEVNFLPTVAKYRVYIIDEVHMLSTAAFNALLKTLEEPPAHVKFILATTEPQKIPTTILSRCQRFDFKKIKEKDIYEGLRRIKEGSKIPITDEALNLISILADGAMRDGISILERCAQEDFDKIDVQDIKDLVGLSSTESINAIANDLADKDEVKAIEDLEKILNDGKDITNFVWELIKYFKDLLVYKVTKRADLYSESEKELMNALSEKFEKDRLLNIIYVLSETENDIRRASQKTILLEVTLIKLCSDMPEGATTSSSGSDLLKRFELLEEEIKKLKEQRINFHYEEKRIGDEKYAEEPLLEEKEEKPKMVFKPGKAGDAWLNILKTLKEDKKMRLYTTLLNTKVNELSDDVWEIYFVEGFTDYFKAVLNDPLEKETLKKEIVKTIGQEVLLKFKGVEKAKTKNGKEDLNSLDIDVRIIE
ncbi:MAG: DNA polymerase III subunit gamma/tau [Clostridia bacterium]|nr:DNA polymerase III subunit gamma/tau [Clostridia bacterium]